MALLICGQRADGDGSFFILNGRPRGFLYSRSTASRLHMIVMRTLRAASVRRRLPVDYYSLSDARETPDKTSARPHIQHTASAEQP